jgi:predicted O-methyltransferase YrrM
MKPFFFNNFINLLNIFKPKTICEIGTHNGKTASQMITHLLSDYTHSLHYIGFDLFELATADTHRREINGKGTGKLEQAEERMAKMTKKFNGRFTYELHQGFTTDTLVVPKTFDFVYIDGGHSYNTVMHDYSMVKSSQVIVFDDYQMADVKKAVSEIAQNLPSSLKLEIWNYEERLKRIQAAIIPQI